MNLHENISRVREIMGLLKEYSEENPDIKYSNQNGYIFIDSIFQVPKVGTPMNKEEFQEDGVSALSWDNIVVVRASNEIPEVKNNYLILHTSRAMKTTGYSQDFMNNLKKRWEDKYSDEPWEDFVTRYKKAVGERWTKHFTLNHMVEDNMGGQWEDVGLIYLIPGAGMVSLNGKPASLYVIDTWYSKSVVLPNNTVILYTDKAKNKVEQISYQFNSQLKGDRLKYNVYLLKINSLSEVDKTIKAMGYSVLGGGAHYSHEKNVDAEFRDFSKSSKTPSFGIHANTFFSELESQTSNFPAIFKNLDWVIESMNDDEVANDWYNQNRRVFKSAMDSAFQIGINKIKQTDFESILEPLDTIKNKLNQYPMIKKFRNDLLKSIEKNDIRNLLKGYLWKEKGYDSLEQFMNEVMPK